MDYRPYSYNPYGNEVTNVWPTMMNNSWYSAAYAANAYSSMNTEASILQSQMNVYNPINSAMVYPKTIKVETWEDIYKALFPYDPIQDWSRKKIEEIDRKYAWSI